MKKSAKEFYKKHNLDELCNEMKKDINDIMNKYIEKLESIERSNDTVQCFYDIAMFQAAVMARKAFGSCCNTEAPVIYQMKETLNDFNEKLCMIMHQEALRGKIDGVFERLLDKLKESIKE